MAKYANKTCYDCGLVAPANEMERVSESYNSGQSNTKVTAGNLAWAAMGDKRGQNAVGRAFKANNRRSYTRNRTVWKCFDCSGRNERIAQTKAAEKAKAEGALRLSEGTVMLMLAGSSLWFLFSLACILLNWALRLDISSNFLWINGIGSLCAGMYASHLHEKREDIISKYR